MAQVSDVSARRSPVMEGVIFFTRIVMCLALACVVYRLGMQAANNTVDWEAYPAFAILCVLVFAAYGMIAG